MPKERPIIFSGDMVRAILEGRKTQTRRVVTPQPPSLEAVREKSGSSFSIFTDHHSKPDEFRVAGPVWAVRELMGREPIWKSPFGAAGDRLWVREVWSVPDWYDDLPPRDVPPEDIEDPNGAGVTQRVWYECDVHKNRRLDVQYAGKKRSPIHMPRWASRITIEITDVRVERLQEITEADAQSEGVAYCDYFEKAKKGHPVTPHRTAFAWHWQQRHGRNSWADNPWVWVVCFKRVHP